MSQVAATDDYNYLLGSKALSTFLYYIQYFVQPRMSHDREKERMFGVENLARTTATLSRVPDRAFSEDLVKAVQNNDLALMR